MKKPIILIIIALVIVGAGVAAYFLWKPKKEVSDTVFDPLNPPIDTSGIVNENTNWGEINQQLLDSGVMQATKSPQISFSRAKIQIQ